MRGDREHLAVYADWLEERPDCPPWLRGVVRDLGRWHDWRDRWAPQLQAARDALARSSESPWYVPETLAALDSGPGQFSLCRTTGRRWVLAWLARQDDPLAAQIRDDLARWIPTRNKERRGGPFEPQWARRLIDLHRGAERTRDTRLAVSLFGLHAAIQRETGREYGVELRKLCERQTDELTRAHWLACLGATPRS